MILQALTHYYEALCKKGRLPLQGFGKANISYALRISPQGELKGIFSLIHEEQRGKKNVRVPLAMIVPEPVVKASGIVSNFLFENAEYFLGADFKGKPERSRECFEAAKALHHQVLDGIDHEAARAVLAFFDTWRPEDWREHPIVSPYLDELAAGGNLIFQLEGDINAHEVEALREAWQNHLMRTASDIRMQCLVTGKFDQPIARLHGKIKGIRGGQPTGTSIVSFNANAYESYGRDGGQGINAPVGEYAAFAYKTALNDLLSGKYCQFFGDTTMAYWAETAEEEYQDIFSSMMIPDESDEEKLHGIMKKIARGEPIASSLDLSTRFYVLGLSPNAGRLAIRFFWPSTFGDVITNVARHYERLEIEKPDYETRKYLSPYWLLRETVPSVAKTQAASPLLEGALLRSIFSGIPYPALLAQSVLVRIRAEHKVTWRKAAILKAWLMNAGYEEKRYEEVLQVSLNQESNNKPYVLGRLFSVLEKAQEEANPGINATIRDRYFASACAAPGTVFPMLLKLSNHHVSKAEYGLSLQAQIGELMDKLDVEDDPFPAQLSLDEQAIFVLGYYHQRQFRYRKKDAQTSK